MGFTVLTLFPQCFSWLQNTSIIGKAIQNGLISLTILNIRDFASDHYKTVDGKPYGGGGGMILRSDIIYKALESIQKKPEKSYRTILLDPGGKTFTQPYAKNLTRYDHIILLCGHYEGIDDRIRTLVDEEISIGEYVLTGGEIPAMTIIDSVARLIPDVLGYPSASEQESYSLIDHHLDNSKANPVLIEYPQYTKPRVFHGLSVPDILLSGNHARIQEWRINEAKKRTKRRKLLNLQMDSSDE